MSKTSKSQTERVKQMQPCVDISVVIVNYNVKEFVANLLQSLQVSADRLTVEYFVVDNASSDGSVPYLKRRFPEVTYIANETNLGFGKANNQAIRQAKGRYTLLINPDTLVREDTLGALFTHMQQHPETAAAGCKLLNADGTFAPESRRAVPTPLSALWKILGLARLFPDSPRFSAYYMGGAPEDEPGRVPVLSGAFMFFRTEVLKAVQGFDEQFFMYGEDIDLCYRVRQLGWEIDYVPRTSTIHYKGESTRKHDLDYVVMFNKAMYQFFKKHYSFGYTFFFRVFILSGILLKGLVSYVIAALKKASGPLVDLGLMNLVVVLFFLWRYDISPGDIQQRYHLSYLLVNGLLSGIYLVAAQYYEVYGKHRFSIPGLVKSVLVAFTGVVVVTFFLRDYAFSRMVLLLACVVSLVLLVMLRVFRIRTSRKGLNIPGNFYRNKVLIVGFGDRTGELIGKLRSRTDWNYELVGLVGTSEEQLPDEVENVPVLGDVSEVKKLVEYHRVDELLFVLPAVNHNQIFRTLSELRNRSVYPRIVPDSLDYILGKTQVEYLDEIPVMDVQLPYFSAWNMMLKRSFDLLVSTVTLLVLTPVLLPACVLSRNTSGASASSHMPGAEASMAGSGKKDERVDGSGAGEGAAGEKAGQHRGGEEEYRGQQAGSGKPGAGGGMGARVGINRAYCASRLYYPVREHIWKNRYLLFAEVVRGRLSLVGPPITALEKPVYANVKPGLTGFRQLHEEALFHEEERQRHERYYLQNYSIWLDMDIMFKTLWRRKKTLGQG